MGIIKFKKKTFFDLFKFYKKLNNSQIDMTTFINEAIKAKYLKLKYSEYNGYWFEIDTKEDINTANKFL